MHLNLLYKLYICYDGVLVELGAEHRGPEDGPLGMHRDSPIRSRGRGRGRLHPSELEMPLDHIPLEIFKKPSSPARKSDSDSSCVDSLQRPQKCTEVFPDSQNKKLDMTRKIECMGESLKISFSNTSKYD